MKKYLNFKGIGIALCSVLLLSVVGCGEKKTKTDVVDSLAKAGADEKWTPAVPDTAWMRKNCAVVEVITSMGRMELALFDATPKHKENFIKLVKSGYYDGLLFHRVIRDFMIQGGDPKSRNAKPSAYLGDGGPGYTIPAEFIDSMHHFRGALAAARTGDDMNPEKASSGSQFYIVTGLAHGTAKLKEALKERALMSFMTNEDNLSYRLRAETYQNRNDMAAMNVLLKEIDAEIKPITDSLYNSLSPRARQLYATWGGFPKLDKEYTVFGSLISGFEVLDAIQKVQTASEDRPVKDVMIIRARVIKE